jgi:hypothetical protein
VGDGDAVAEETAEGDDAVAAGVAGVAVAVAVEAPSAPYPDADEDAANVLAVKSPIARTAPASKVMYGDLSFMSRGTPAGPHPVLPWGPLSLNRYELR